MNNYGGRRPAAAAPAPPAAPHPPQRAALLRLLIRPTLQHCICPTEGVRAYCSACGYGLTFGRLLRDWELSQPRPAERPAAAALRATQLRLRTAATPPPAAAPPAAAIPPPIADPPPPHAAAAPVLTRSHTQLQRQRNDREAAYRADAARLLANANAYNGDDDDEGDEGEGSDDSAAHWLNSDGDDAYFDSPATKRRRTR